MKSDLQRGGAVYTQLFAAPLAANPNLISMRYRCSD